MLISAFHEICLMCGEVMVPSCHADCSRNLSNLFGIFSEQSVTAFGRMMIELTKKHVEDMFTVANGYEHNAQVGK